MRVRNNCKIQFIVFVLIISFPAIVFADWSYGDVDLTTNLSIVNYKNCSIAYASAYGESDSDVDWYEGPPVCYTSVNAAVPGAYGMGANFFPAFNYSGFGEYGTDADVTAADGASQAKLKTECFSPILTSDYQTDFQIDHIYDVLGVDSWAIFYISLWSGSTPEGDVLPQHILLEEKDGWVYSDVGSVTGNEFWVLAKSYSFDAIGSETTIWPDLNLYTGSSYGVYAGLSSIVNPTNDPYYVDLSPLQAGLVIPEPATVLLLGMGGLVIRRRKA